MTGTQQAGGPVSTEQGGGPEGRAAAGRPGAGRHHRAPGADGAASRWIGEARAVFLKDWRSELRTRYALNTIALFALTTLVLITMSLGPMGVASPERTGFLPVLLWMLLLFSASSGLPRAFVHEEETHTATALRLAATPSALFCGKLAYSLVLLYALEALTTPVFLAMVALPVADPLGMLVALLVGGYGLAAGSTLVAAIVAQARGKGTLFAVLSFPILLPLVLLAVELTRAAVSGVAPGQLLPEAILYDATVTVAALMLFPAIWNP